MRFIRQCDIIENHDGRGSMWSERGLQCGTAVMQHPVVYRGETFDVWHLGPGRYCTHAKPAGNLLWEFETLEEAVAMASS